MCNTNGCNTNACTTNELDQQRRSAKVTVNDSG
jgi:hypothetical protein